jgi:hypothetical protein
LVGRQAGGEITGGRISNIEVGAYSINSYAGEINPWELLARLAVVAITYVIGRVVLKRAARNSGGARS